LRKSEAWDRQTDAQSATLNAAPIVSCPIWHTAGQILDDLKKLGISV